MSILNLFKKNKEPKYFDAEIDLSRFDVLAIERNDEGETVITYKDPTSPLIHEFWLSCSPKKHNELVEEFRLDLATSA
jgi:hypothetical protein